MRFVATFPFGMIRVDKWNRYYKIIKNHIFKYLCPLSWSVCIFCCKFGHQCLLLWWWWKHWHEIPSFPRLWPAYPLSLSPWQLRNKLQAAPSLLYPAEWKFIYDDSSFTFQTPAMTWPLVTKSHEVCQCHCCMDDDTQTAQLLGVVGVNGLCLSSWICS